MNDLWEIEREATKKFRQSCDEVGFAIADLAFDEAGLNRDFTTFDKLEAVNKVVEKLKGELDE